MGYHLSVASLSADRAQLRKYGDVSGRGEHLPEVVPPNCTKYGGSVAIPMPAQMTASRAGQFYALARVYAFGCPT